MSQPPPTFRLLSLDIRAAQDVVLARQRARELAEALGFEIREQTTIAAALSEIARNAFDYAQGGTVEFFVSLDERGENGDRALQTLRMTVTDHGPGISNLEAILDGHHASIGLGIKGARRLVDTSDFQTSPQGTVVTLVKALPKDSQRLSGSDLQAIVDDLQQRPAATPLQELQRQNQELIRALDEVRIRQEDLSRLNQELTDTNSGVLALYDELETLHRITTMLASKLELRPLIQTIIDVTTTLTAAAQGAFFFREDETAKWRFYASSGVRGEIFGHVPEEAAAAFFAMTLDDGALMRIPDTSQVPGFTDLAFCQTIGERILMRSCFVVPVVDQHSTVLGAMVFASARPSAFSERSERILTSVAAQAVVGIEKARLFHSVSAASEAKDQFLAMISHELRTPLSPAMAIISSLQDDPRVPASLAGDLAIVWRNIRLEARLIDDLLDFNRLIKGKMEIVPMPLDMHAVIHGVIQICREELDAKSHRIEVDLKASRAVVSGDSARLQQVLWNVVKNAIKFTPPAGLISIRSMVIGPNLRIEVTDNGHGIEPASLERIFHAFDQGPHRMAAGLGGMGLGLSIARMFVVLHGGSISAISEGRDRGSSFHIELPLSSVEPPQPTPLPQVKDEPKRTSGRILLVDDHPDTLQSLRRLLAHRGYEVTAVDSAAQAKALALSGKFDLLISDLGLPDCSGLDLLRQIRAITPLPAIAMSGYGMESDVANSTAAGFQAHLTKPVDFRELARMIEQVLATGIPAS